MVKNIIRFTCKLELIFLFALLFIKFDKVEIYNFRQYIEEYFVFVHAIGYTYFFLNHIFERFFLSRRIILNVIRSIFIIIISNVLGSIIGLQLLLYIFWVEFERGEKIFILQRNFLLIIIIAIISLLYRYYENEIKRVKEEKEKAQIESKLKLLQARLNPHFLFNTLNSVLALAYKNNYDLIENAISRLSKMYRKILELPDNYFIAISEELDLIEDYLEVEKIRLKERLTYEINIDDELRFCPILSLIIEIPVENAVIHGISKNKAGGHICVNISKKNNRILIRIIDNGVGYKEEKNGKGFGIYSLKRRLKMAYGKDTFFEIKSGMENGTIVTMEVPYDLKNTNS